MLDILPVLGTRASTQPLGQHGESTVNPFSFSPCPPPQKKTTTTPRYSPCDIFHFIPNVLQDLKYDNCFVPSNWTDECAACTGEIGSPQLYENGTCSGKDNICPPGYNYTASNTAERYRVMGNALLAQNRTIHYSICVWGYEGVEEWGNQTGNSWRMSTDIERMRIFVCSSAHDGRCSILPRFRALT